jgi:hypothetical protein
LKPRGVEDFIGNWPKIVRLCRKFSAKILLIFEKPWVGRAANLDKSPIRLYNLLIRLGTNNLFPKQIGDSTV